MGVDNLVRLQDLTPMGQLLHEFELALPAPSVTVRQLIETRVRAEVEAYASGRRHAGYQLFEADEVELLLNQHDVKLPSKLSVERQVAIALKGFESNQFFIIINDSQVTSLDEPVFAADTEKVEFVRLIALVGG